MWFAAIGQSLALTAGIMCPLAALILLSGIKHVKKAIEDREAASSQA